MHFICSHPLIAVTILRVTAVVIRIVFCSTTYSLLYFSNFTLLHSVKISTGGGSGHIQRKRYITQIDPTEKLLSFVMSLTFQKLP